MVAAGDVTLDYDFIHVVPPMRAPDAVRGFLPVFAYQCGVLVAGSVVYVEAVFAARFSYTWAMACTAATVFTGCAIIASLGPEKRGVVYGEAA